MRHREIRVHLERSVGLFNRFVVPACKTMHGEKFSAFCIFDRLPTSTSISPTALDKSWLNFWRFFGFILAFLRYLPQHRVVLCGSFREEKPERL